MKHFVSIVFLGLSLALTGCPGDDAERQTETAAEPGLTAFELEHGIGPITEPVELGPIDYELAARGQAVYEMNCEACHQMEGRLVGPPLGDITERRSPAFIMNMILNPEEMARQHPEGQAMMAEYHLVMPFQNITEEQARAILEYLRTEHR